MPHVGNNNEPLLDRLVFAFDGTLYKPLALDSDGYLRTSEQHPLTTIAATVSNWPSTQPVSVSNWPGTQPVSVSNWPSTQQVSLAADQNVQARQYGYVGSAWQKQPINLGFTASLTQIYSNTALAAGSNTLTIYTVPANTVAVIDTVSVSYVGTDSGVKLRIRFRCGGVGANVAEFPYITTTLYYFYHGQMALNANDTVEIYVASATLNDALYAGVAGRTIATNL